MPLFKIRFSTKEIIDEMVLNLDTNDEAEGKDVLVRFYKVDNPIIISIAQVDSVSSKSYSSNFYDGSNETVKTDPYAILTFCTGLIGFMVLPILFVPVCFFISILSYYRLKDNKSLKGNGLRLTGALINSVNILYLYYSFKTSEFNF